MYDVNNPSIQDVHLVVLNLDKNGVGRVWEGKNVQEAKDVKKINI